MRRVPLRFVLIVACVLSFPAGSWLSAETVDPQKATPSAEGDTLWYDCQRIGIEGRGWTDTLSPYDRLPANAEGKAPKKVWELSHHSAGLCIRFSTDAPTLQVRWTLISDELAMLHMPATGVSGVDLYAKLDGRWRFAGNGRPKGVSNSAKFNVPRHAAELLLYLPLYNGVKSVEIGIPKDRTIATPDAAALKTRKTIVFYGTSITQGGCASRPGMAFTAIVGRRLDAAIINLGFSGSGKMEPEMGDLVAGLDPSLFVLDCVGNMTVKEVSERIEPFVKRLRESHADTPILLSDDSAYRTAFPTEKGRVLRAAYEKLTGDGVKNLYFMPKEGTLGDDGEATVDGVHPSDLGMLRQADAFTQAIRPLLETAARPAIDKPIMFDTPEADKILDRLQVFPPDNPWNQDVSKWPVHPNSQNIIASIGAAKPLRHNIDMGFILVPPKQARVPVKIVGYPDESDKGPFPVPDNMPIEGWPANYQQKKVTLADVQRDKLHEGGDRHGIVVDPENLLLYEFYQALKTDAGWQAAQASVFDLKTNKLRPEGWTSSDAAGLPVFPAVVRYDELRRGMVAHALRVTVEKTRRAYIHPATHFASSRTDPNLPRMGERLRLKQDFSIDGFSPNVQVILKGLKKYGMLVADNGLDWDISVAPDARIPPMHDELRRIKGSAFEVVEPPK